MRFDKLKVKKFTMKKDKIIKIITPSVASSKIELDLVKLTERLVKTKKCDWVGGILGGEFGYGCDFKNKVFEMRPFYWGECDCGGEKTGKHSQKCSLELPNFKHYKSGLEIRWYKWIGRDMEFNKSINKGEWKEIFQECIKSIK